MKTIVKNTRKYLFGLFLITLLSGQSYGQNLTISGDQTAFVGDQKQYVLSGPAGTNLGEITWLITAGGATITPSSNSFQATVNFNLEGQTTVYVSARNFAAPFTSYLTGTFTVTVDGPETPPNPAIKTNACGTAVIQHRANIPIPNGYRWYWQGKSSTSTSTSLGYANEFTLNAGSGTYYLRARHTASGAWSTDASSITLTIEQFDGGSIEIQGGDNTVCYNGDPPFLVNDIYPKGRSNLGTSYVWQYANSSSGPWNNTSGTSVATYNPPAGLTTDRWYRRKVTSCGGQVKYSNVIMIDVRPQLAAGGINGAQTICYNGNPSTLGTTASASNGEGGYIYQWQISTNGSSSWTNISAATSTTYNPPGAMTASRWYRRRVISCGQTKYTNTVKVTVRGALTAGSTSGTQNICYGGNPNQISSIGSGANGDTYSYQWQVSTNNSSWSNVSGATSTNYTPPTNATADRWYRRRVISCGQTKYANTVFINVGPSLTAGNISGAQTICSGSNPTNLVSTTLASGGDTNYTYQWQISTNNSTWTDVAGATGSSYNPSASLTASTWYRRRVVSCGQTAYTPSIAITIIPTLGAPTGPATVAGCEYGNLNISLTPASGGNSVRWYTTPTGGSHIDQDALALTNVSIGSVYYGSTFNSSAVCESATRKQVTIVAAPQGDCGAPDSGDQNTFISGDTNMFVGEERDYTINGVNLTDIIWQVPSGNGTVISTSPNNYTATIRFDSPGQFNINVSGRDLDSQTTNYLNSNLQVFVNGPQVPLAPLIDSNNCSIGIIKHVQTPPTGIRWYWQGKNATSTSTALGYASTFTLNAGNGTYYLKSYHVASNTWSASASSINVSIATFTDGGSIDFEPNSNAQICYNGDPPNLFNSGLPPGRNTTDTTYAWEYAGNENGPWLVASGETNGFSYVTPTGLSADRWYRRKATSCGGEVRYSNVLMVTVSGSTQVPQGDSSYEVCPQGTVNIDLTVESGNVVRWYINQTATNYLEEGVFTLTGASIGGTYYASSYNTTSGCESARLPVTITAEPLANCGNNGGPDLGTDPDINLTISGDNYVYTRAYQTEQATASNFFTPDDNLIQQITYFDGIGRGIQQLAIDHSPQKQDIVTHMEYDDYGRTLKEYLPYASAQGTIGSLKTGNVAQINTWYDVLKYENAQNPFSEKEVEDSPLNRVYKQAAPGNDWALGQGNEIEFDYDTNTAADNVRQFEVSLAASGDTYVPTLIENSTNLEYGAGELFKSVTKDENHSSGNNHSTEEFTDKQGKVVLKRTYADVTNTDGSVSATEPHDTYYVYDDHGNLSFVLPPLMEATTTAIGTLITSLPDLAYRYVYDQRNRLVEKQIPGKEKEYIVYNTLDQPIMTQDANQRSKSPDEWLFTKYDAFGRVAYTGKATSPDTTSREDIQGEVDALTTQLWVEQASTGTNFGGAQNLYYNNGSFPTQTSTNSVVLSEILTINYYDAYVGTPSGAPASITILGSNPVENQTNKVQGLPTVSKVKVLDTNDWITSLTYYDKKGRPVYSYSNNNYLETIDILETQLDFIAKPLKTRATHTRNTTTIITLDNFTYDHVGRLLSQTQCVGDENLGDSCTSAGGSAVASFLTINGEIVTDARVAAQNITVTESTLADGARLYIDANATGTGGAEELIVFNQYDELGQLEAKKVGGVTGTDYTNTAGLQTVNYAYNVRGWLEAINDTVWADNNLSLAANDLWGFKIKYNDIADSNKKLFNGNISQTLWDSKSVNTSANPISSSYTYSYDPLNRITIAKDNTGHYNLSNVSYDKNGNILTLDRKGHTNVGATIFGNMDDLGYVYDSGNKLLKVTDGISGTAGDGGFKNGTNTNDDFEYDDNGNLILDHNKGITSILWNHLNMPTEIKFDNSNTKKINYVYSADGVKVRKIVNDNGNVATTDYAVAYQYVNNSLKFIRNFEDGYVYPKSGSGFGYTYYYTDQLDNIRLAYTDTDGNGSINPNTEIIKESHFYPFGMVHKGYNNVVNPVGSSFHKYDYQNQERQDELGLNWLQFKYRMHDPEIGRFISVDPLAEDYVHNSTYAFAENKVIKYNELEGLEITLNKFDRMSYENKSWLGKAGTFVGNAGVGIVNGAIDAFNYAGDLTDPKAPLTGLSFGANKLADDTSATAGAIADYAGNTSLSEFGTDVGNVLSDVETYENLAGALVSGAGVTKLGKLGSVGKVGVADKLQSAANKALKNVGDGKGAVHGTKVHTEFGTIANKIDNVTKEVSYKNGEVVPYGTKGSVRADAIEGNINRPNAIYDLKTGEAKVTQKNIDKYNQHVPGKPPVKEIKPNN